ncbi:shikimate kinase [Bergeyella sp. RCAD1439]|uniref:shikimate kinase n=1 Tax=Bergeyella anatis TaxID=3113737 RepID=UPI002E177964|nr:shikimate kinase [Bergeyella sp. RCAD1439]
MILSLLGYMGCGKSHIAKILSQKTNLKCVDLDKEIIFQQNRPISEIFAQKGELYFRKIERKTLENLLNQEENFILSLGGGTPAYYDNMALITRHSVSVYLQASVPTLVSRLEKQKAKRPLIAQIPTEDLPEFIAKHLFERAPYYNQALYKIATDGKTPETVAEEIIRLLPPH